jgi:chromosome segregation ATPase
VELLQRILAAHKNAPVGQVKIIIGSEKRLRKVIIFNTANGEIQRPASKLRDMETTLTSSGDESEDFGDSENGDEDRSEETTATSLDASDIGTPRSGRKSSRKKRKSKKRLATVQPRSFIEMADKDCQTIMVSEDIQPEEYANEDDWIRDLRKGHHDLKIEKAALKDQLNVLQSELDDKNRELLVLKARVEEMRSEVEQIRESRKRPMPPLGGLSLDDDSSSESSRKKKKKDPLRAEVTDRAVQKNPGLCDMQLDSASLRSFEMVSRVFLTYQTTYEWTYPPDPSEKAKLDARAESVTVELGTLQKTASQQKQELEHALKRIGQMGEAIAQRDEIIGNMEQQLIDARAAYKQSLNEMKDEHERDMETRLREMQDRMSLPKVSQATTDSHLEEVSLRIQTLNRDRARLDDELRRATEANRVMRARCDEMQDRLRRTERENLDLQEKATAATRQNKAVEYNSGLKMKFDALRKKHEELKREFERLKVSRAGRNDYDRKEETEVVERKPVDTKMAVRLEELRMKNEEMQLKLSKANSTNERLNQLVQRKEAQLTTLQEQIMDLRNQLAGRGGAARGRRS